MRLNSPHLSGYGLRRALIMGSQRVIARREEINRLNVYPVADHDTGTNLAYTLGAVLQGLREPVPVGAGAVWQRTANDVADRARGCSGVILAQFFHGIAEKLADCPRLTIARFTEAVDRGAAQARAALAEPCEGTILSVIQAFADALHAPAGPKDLRTWFAAAVARAREALRQTQRQLPALRAAGVVDAGAQGFVHLLEGISDYLERGRRAPKLEIPAELLMAGVDATRTGEGPHRYGVECLITAPRVDRESLKAALRALPLSDQVITGTGRQLRLHVHCDDPDAVLAVAAGCGTVSRTQIEDFVQANRMAGHRRPRVGIVTDSGGDLPAEEIARLDIHLVPQRLSIAGRDEVDGVTISTQEFYRAMRDRGLSPRTSQPPPGDFRRLFEHLLAHHDSVVDVSLCRILSGTMQSAESAAARVGPGRVHVFDTHSLAAGQGLLTLWAAEAAQAGLDAPRILEGLARMRTRTSLFGIVRDVRYAVRGGRVPRVALTLTRLLRFALTMKTRPTGKLGLHGVLWGRRNQPERFARSVARHLDPARRYRVIVGHGDCADDARRVQAALQRSGRTIERCWIVDTGVAVGAHAGPGTLVIGVQDYEPPKP